MNLPNPSALDWRRVPRLEREADHLVVRVRIRPGYEAVLLNVSAGGALVEGPCRLLPGSTVDLHITGGAERLALRALVMRCTVSRLWAASVWYSGALAFDRQLPWLPGGESGESVPFEQVGASPLVRAVASHAMR